jgi:hypothetical protein
MTGRAGKRSTIRMTTRKSRVRRLLARLWF